MNAIVPLISSSAKGPLGVAHLPRLWLKLRLAAAGRLAEGYRSGHGGFDGIVLDALGIDADAAIAFVAAEHPHYLDFEAWIRAQVKPEALTPQAIAALNERILTFPKPEPSRSEQLQLLGLPDDGSEWLGWALNDLEDWQGFHKALRAEDEPAP